MTSSLIFEHVTYSHPENPSVRFRQMPSEKVPRWAVDVQSERVYFDGETYVHARDSSRLGDQMQAVFELMKDGKERTLKEIADGTGSPESSVSARLRDLRKERFGGHTVERTYIARGLFSYRLLLAEVA